MCLSFRKHDNDQYLCSLLIPREARAGVHILRAFNLELAHVASRHAIPTIGGSAPQDSLHASPLSQQTFSAANPASLLGEHIPTEGEENQIRVGLMKLHWWRDGLETAMENVEHLRLQPAASSPAVAAAAAVSDDGVLLGTAAHAQPVLNMLAIACRQYRLTPRWLSRMMDAREKSLTEGQPQDITSLLSYAESTSSALIYLSLECMGVRDMHADHAASHIGKALGILLTLRALPYSASKQQIFLPRDILRKEQVDVSSVLAGENSEALANCVFELASIAKSHVEHARGLMKDVPAAARPALVSSVLCDLFLERLEQRQFNLFDPNLGLLPTVDKDAADPKKDASIAGVSLSGSSQGLQPLKLRLQLLKHRWNNTY